MNFCKLCQTLETVFHQITKHFKVGLKNLAVPHFFNPLLSVWICIGNSTVSRGIWDKYCWRYFKIHQNITSRRGGGWYLGSFEIWQAGIYPKYPKETVLFPVYTTRQRNFTLYVTGVIFTCKYFKFGLNTTGLSQSHFRNLSACSITDETLFAVFDILYYNSISVSRTRNHNNGSYWHQF